MFYTTDQIKQQAPAVFTTKASPSMSSKYDFVPTFEILENFQREGWQVSSANQVGNNPYGLHQLRIRNKEFGQVGDSIVEAIIRNSHNGLSSFSVSAGLHRLVCSNGLTVPTSVASSLNVRHMSLDISDVRRITDEFAGKLPIIGESLQKMSSTKMSDEQVEDFANKSKLLRWVHGSVPTSISVEELVSPVRVEDSEQTVWNVFNRVQEKFVRGGISYRTNKGRYTSLRGLKNIHSLNNINSKLWELAESYC
jgi:hypothetical protein